MWITGITLASRFQCILFEAFRCVGYIQMLLHLSSSTVDTTCCFGWISTTKCRLVKQNDSASMLKDCMCCTMTCQASTNHNDPLVFFYKVIPKKPKKTNIINHLQRTDFKYPDSIIRKSNMKLNYFRVAVWESTNPWFKYALSMITSLLLSVV